jgi:ribosomal protein S12 methylthiotransferase
MAISLPILDQTAPQLELPAAGDSAKGKYAFVSLGCPKNLVDSERMLGLLQSDGYQLVQDPDKSDFVVINTCGFIDSAREESMASIDQMLELKRTGKIKGVIVTGCLAERQREKLLEARPEIDGLVGVFGREEITTIVDRFLSGLEEQRSIFKPAPIRALPDTNRLQVTPQHFAYLKISEGCDRLCTFCAIPKMRGKHASKPMESVIEEAKQLADNGVRELVIVAQDTTFYHIDIDGKPRLAELLEKLNEIEGLDWIRLMYFYPMYIDQNLVDTMAGAQRILPYVDIPLQHINNTMLKRMSRRVNRESTMELLHLLRDGIPDLAIRTTFIAGFPGETQDHVDELAQFITEMKFQRAGVFTYSLEPDTPAARLGDHLPDNVKAARRDQLMAAQQANAFAWCESQIGKSLDVILDKPVEGQSNVWVGRSYADAPDVDGVVFVTGTEHQLKTGQIVESEIVMSKEYDLVGVAVGDPR